MVSPPADDASEGYAIKDHASAHLTLPRTQPPRPGTEVDARSFSPLNAPQRAAVDAFCHEARPWALRQARRTYGHLPRELQEQAADQALLALRRGAPRGFDRKTLYAELTDELTEALRRVHVGWCLNRAEAGWRRQAAERPTLVPEEPGPAPGPDGIAAFVEDGLAGLERAVLQLELGAGRDTNTARAALRLAPRQYARHREQGLSKLRAAVLGQARGRVCNQHLDAVALAATGDAAAAERLASGPDRCRACAREANALSRTLQQRLIVAPWPLVIKPAGALAAKLGAVSALFGGKSATTGGVTAALTGGPVGTGTGAVVTALAAAAVATGGIAAVGASGEVEKVRATAPAAAVAVAAEPAKAARVASAAPNAAKKQAAKPARRKQTPKAERRTAATGPTTTAAAPAPTTAPSAPAGSAPATAPAPVDSLAETVDNTVDGVRKVAEPVTKVLPAPVQQTVDGTLGGVQDTAESVTGAVDGLLAPQP